MLPTDTGFTGYSATGARSLTFPPGWTFGHLDPVQAHRAARQLEQLQAIEQRRLSERAAEARRAILAQAGEALL